MTDVAKVAATAATFDVGVYSDGSGPVVRVHYDVKSDYSPGNIWLDCGEHSGLWLAFDAQHTEALVAAIMSAAAGVRAHLANPTEGTDHG